MSLGSVFTLLNNTGSADKLLFANDYLKSRINQFIKIKDPEFTVNQLLTQPNDNTYLNVRNSILPSLNEIEKSHCTFVNGSYKPGIMLTSEYFKVTSTRPEFDSKLTFQLPQIGQFTTDTVLHIRLSGLRALDSRDRVRYTALLGHKLVKHVQLTINNSNLVDEFGTDDFNAHLQFEVDGNHKEGYLRNIGQETPQTGFITSDPGMDMHREYRSIGNGNQTLKQSHASIDLHIPLLFWFKNTKTALPSIPWGQIQIQVFLAQITDIIGFADNGGGGGYTPPVIDFCDLYINQLFTTPEIFSLFAKKFVFSLIRVHRHHKESIKVDQNNKYGVLLNNLKWPTEQIYFSFRPRDNLKLSQYWHKNVKLTERVYKVPVVAKDTTTVVVGNFLQATANTAVLSSTVVNLSTVTNTYNNYDLIITGGNGYMQDIVENRYIIKDYVGSTNTVTIAGTWHGVLPDATTTYELYNAQLAINLVSYYQEEPIVNSISLEANGIEIYKSNYESFYNSYLTTKYKNFNTPDMGSYMMTFCINPNTHSPSGSLNVSLCRELYLRFTSCIIDENYAVDLIVLAKAINFLLIDEGSLSLRYNL